MKNSALFKKILIILFSTALLCLTASFTVSFTGVKKVGAYDGDIAFSRYTPVSAMEIYDFGENPPNDVYRDETVTAMITGTNTIVLYTETANFQTVSDSGFNSLRLIKRLGADYLIVQDYNVIKKIKITGEHTISELRDTSDSTVTSNYFDVSDKYLVTASGEVIKIYDVDGDSVTGKSVQITGIDGNSPVSVFGENVFFVRKNAISGESTLCKFNLNSSVPEEKMCSVTKAEKIACDGRFLYYIDNSVLKCVPINGGSEKTLNSSSTPYDLGKIVAPTGICFYNGKLLISDKGINAVSEFSVTDDALTFTGFAIANGKTAFNRIGASGQITDLCGNRLAVLDNKKLTVINDFNGDLYSYDNFSYTAPIGGELFDGYVFDDFALGLNTTMLVDKTKKSARLFNFTDNSFGDEISFQETLGRITDVYYLDGYYYVLQLVSGESSFGVTVLRSAENQLEFTPIIRDESAFVVNKLPVLTVDVFGNVYVTNTSDGYVYKYEIKDGAYGTGAKLSFAPNVAGKIKEMRADLGGNLFALTDDSVLCFADNRLFTLKSATLGLRKFSSFAMSYETKKVFVTLEGEEGVFETISLPNMDISAFTVPDDYRLTDSCARDISDLKLYELADDSNAYSVSVLDVSDVKKFEYDGFIKNKTLSGALVGKFDLSSVITDGSDSVTRTETFCVIATVSQKGEASVFVVNERNLKLIEPDVSESTDEKVYCATGVRLYYLPFITKDETYACSNGNDLVWLKKAVEFSPTHVIDFLGAEFYFGTYFDGQNDYKGYVPVKFVTPVLAEDYHREKYSFATVDGVTVYSDEEMTVQLKFLADGTKIKLLSASDGISKIAFDDDGTWVVGYILSEKIRNAGKNTLRNVLIIIAVTTSVCATSIYLLSKKKEYKD